MAAFSPAAGAATTTAHLRVVNTAGTTLADQSQVTGDVTVKTDTGTDCFGNTSSGQTYSVAGPTALGIVKDASDSNGALRPLSFTDSSYPGFGLGICGIGGFTFTKFDSQFWYLKVNHVGATVGGSQYFLNPGDQVLWYLTPGYGSPEELQLEAPTSARSGESFAVHVFGFNDGGTRTPIAGAVVNGADQPTGADGSTTMELMQTLKLQALHGTDIPSNQVVVACIPTTQSPCGFASRVARHKIVGTNRPDRIRGTGSPDLIRSRAGRDRINTRGGFEDVVNCGRGRDTATVDDADITRRGERVIHKG
jgi:hypothetical protein